MASRLLVPVLISGLLALGTGECGSSSAGDSVALHISVVGAVDAVLCAPSGKCAPCDSLVPPCIAGLQYFNRTPEPDTSLVRVDAAIAPIAAGSWHLRVRGAGGMTVVECRTWHRGDVRGVSDAMSIPSGHWTEFELVVRRQGDSRPTLALSRVASRP